MDVRRPDPDPPAGRPSDPRWPQPAPVDVGGLVPQQKGLATSSVIIGLVSLVAGFTVVCPLAGLVVGIMALCSEPDGHDRAIAGILLNGAVLAALVSVLAIIVGALAQG